MNLMLTAFIVVFGFFAEAGNPPQITATLSSPKIRPGDPFQLTISIKSQDEMNLETPSWSVPDGIENQGVSTRTSIQSNLVPGPNGMVFDKKRSVDYVFQLEAHKQGVFKLGPFTIKAEDQTYTLGPVNLEVTSKAPAPSRQNRNSLGGLGGLVPPGFDDEEEDNLFGQLLRRQRQAENIPSRQLPINEKEAFFIIVETDKKEAFEGEQIFASWYIYTRGNIHQFDRLKFPALKGFWKEDVEPAPNLNFEKEMVNGVLFHRALLASYALFPIKAGTILVDEYKIRALVSLPSPGFGGFGFGQPYSYTRTSEPLKVLVKPLPTEGRPTSFAGAVGNFRVEAHVDNQNFTQGQPFSLRIRFDGDGNAKLIELPRIQWPEELELYDTKAESRFFQSGKSFKEFTVMIIPKKAGVLKIPPIELSYFDPVTATYKTTQTQEIALQVAPGTVQATDSERMNLAKENQSKSLDPVLPEPQSELTNRKLFWFNGLTMFFVWSAFYLILFGLSFGAHWIWLKQLYKKRTLAEELRERKVRWEKDIKAKRHAQAAIELINSIYFLLSRLADEGGFTKDLNYLLDQLPPSIRNEVSVPLRKELEILQAVAFAPEEAWKEFAAEANFRKHSERTFEILEQTLKLSDEGAVVSN